MMRKKQSQNRVFFNQNVIIGQDGFVLVVSLLLLVVVTLIGVIALSSSTTEVMVSGNARIKELNFSTAEGGIDTSIPVIKYFVFYGPNPTEVENTNYKDIVIDTSLASELRGGNPFDADASDINFDITKGDVINAKTQQANVMTDIDYMFAVTANGSSIEFAAGYDGLGKGLGAGGAYAFYRINSASRDSIGSDVQLGSIYRYVSK